MPSLLLQIHSTPKLRIGGDVVGDAGVAEAAVSVGGIVKLYGDPQRRQRRRSNKTESAEEFQVLKYVR
jgi:hypothetical protein